MLRTGCCFQAVAGPSVRGPSTDGRSGGQRSRRRGCLPAVRPGSRPLKSTSDKVLGLVSPPRAVYPAGRLEHGDRPREPTVSAYRRRAVPFELGSRWAHFSLHRRLFPLWPWRATQSSSSTTRIRACETLSAGNFFLHLYRKLDGGGGPYIETGSDSFACLIGQLLYRGASGEEALRRYCADLAHGQLDNHRVIGEFALIVKDKSSLRLPTDPLGFFQLYVSEGAGKRPVGFGYSWNCCPGLPSIPPASLVRVECHYLRQQVISGGNPPSRCAY